MRIPSQSRNGTLGFNMTPMIDVVFLLIIFFLVSSHLAKQEVHMELPLPKADSGTEPAEADVSRVTVNITADGTLLLAGHRVTPQQLQQRLANALAKEGGDLQVRIRSDRHAPYRYVEPIMLACARAGVWNVTFAVFQREDAR